MPEFVAMVREVGFPVAIAVFVLWRLDTHLVEVRDELRELRIMIGDRRRNLRSEDPPRAAQ